MKKLLVKVLQQFLTTNFNIKTVSEIGIGQVHKRNKNIVKTDGRAIWILDDEVALLEWVIFGSLFQK